MQCDKTFHSVNHTNLSFVGIEINDKELARFVERVDKDNNGGVITFEKWRDFLLLYPQEATIENIYHHVGEQAVIPGGISKHAHASRYLIAGAVAGATSRTATAPLDRLKVVLQVTNNAGPNHASNQRYMEKRWIIGILSREWSECFEGGP